MYWVLCADRSSFRVYIGRILNNMASHLHYLVQGVVYLLSQIMCGITIASYGCGLRHVRCRSFCKHWFETHMARESFIKNQPLGPTRPVCQILEIDSSYRWEMLTKCVNPKFVKCGCVFIQRLESSDNSQLLRFCVALCDDYSKPRCML